MGREASPDSIHTLFERKGTLVADGGMGTSLFSAGLRPGDLPERWNVDRTEEVVDVHRGFVEAGSDIILTNTFGGTRTRLDLDGMGGRVVELNAAGVAAARQAAGSSVVIAGSVGPTGGLFEPLGPMTHAQAVEVFTEQMAALVESGVDVLWIETLSSLEELAAAVTAAREFSLPVVTTMSFDTNGHTMMGVAPAQFASWWTGQDVAPFAIGANCGVGPPDTVRAVYEIGESDPQLTVVAKANCGIPEVIDGTLWYPSSSDDMTPYAELALDAGARILGACCGSTPDHIAQIRRVVDAYQPRASLDPEVVERRLGGAPRPAARAPRRRRRNRSAVTPVD